MTLLFPFQRWLIRNLLVTVVRSDSLRGRRGRLPSKAKTQQPTHSSTASSSSTLPGNFSESWEDSPTASSNKSRSATLTASASDYSYSSTEASGSFGLSWSTSEDTSVTSSTQSSMSAEQQLDNYLGMLVTAFQSLGQTSPSVESSFMVSSEPKEDTPERSANCSYLKCLESSCLKTNERCTQKVFFELFCELRDIISILLYRKHFQIRNQIDCLHHLTAGYSIIIILKQIFILNTLVGHRLVTNQLL